MTIEEKIKSNLQEPNMANGGYQVSSVGFDRGEVEIKYIKK